MRESAVYVDDTSVFEDDWTQKIIS